MKVLVLGNGESPHTIQFVSGMVSHGLEVILCSQHGFSDSLPNQVHRRALSGRGTIGYFLNAPAVRAIAKRERVDVVNAHYASGYGTTARLSGVGPILLNAWGSDVFDFPFKSKLHRHLVAKNLRAATAVGSTGTSMGRHILSLCPSAIVEITPLGVDTTVFTPSSRPGNGDIVVGSVKSLNPLYGPDRLIQAFALARQTLQREGDYQTAEALRLRFVGPGETAHLVQLAIDEGVGQITAFDGPIEHSQVPGALAEFDIFATLSRMESYGVSALEAQACGLPVISSDAIGFMETIADGESGFLTKDTHEAAVAIVRLARDRQLRMRMGQVGRQRVQEKFSLPSCAAAMHSALSSSVSRHKHHKELLV